MCMYVFAQMLPVYAYTHVLLVNLSNAVISLDDFEDDLRWQLLFIASAVPQGFETLWDSLHAFYP